MGCEEPFLISKEFKEKTLKDHTFNLIKEREKMKQMPKLSI